MSRTPRAHRAPALLIGWLVGGCAVDLWVGEPAGTTTGSTGATLDPSTTTPASAGSTGTTGAPGGGTSEAGTTTAADEGTTTGIVAEGTSSTGAAEGSTTVVEVHCEGLGMLDCNELGYCLWYGTPEVGECLLSPCEDLLHDCWELPMRDCQALAPCIWVTVTEPPACSPIECVPCELLELGQCTETPTCTWNEGEMACLPA